MSWVCGEACGCWKTGCWKTGGCSTGACATGAGPTGLGATGLGATGADGATGFGTDSGWGARCADQALPSHQRRCPEPPGSLYHPAGIGPAVFVIVYPSFYRRTDLT